MGNLLLDLKYGLRVLVKNPAFTAIVVISLGLGIGANTTIFSFVNALLFRPPAVEAPGRLVEVWQRNTKGSGIEEYIPLAYPDYAYYRDHNEVFDGFLAFDGEMRPASWSNGGQGERVQGQLVSGNFFSVLGVRPALGRAFMAEEDQVTSPRSVLVLSHKFWVGHLGSDSGILGKNLTLNGVSFSVVGVAPPGFAGILVGNEPDFWLPLAATPILTRDTTSLTSTGAFWLFGVGRLKSGVEASRAQAELTILSRHLQQAEAENHKDVEAALFSVNLVPGPFRGYVAAFTGLLMAVVGMVLLIACANAANLLLAKATSRRREIAIRSALGGSRARLVRQALTESILLGTLSGFVGLILAFWTVPLIFALKPPSLPIRFDPPPLDWRVLSFTFVLSLATGVIFGLAPALRSSRLDLTSALKDEAYAIRSGRSRLRHALVTAQVAVCVVLLVGAGLCVRSLINAGSIDPGFDTRHLVIAELDPEKLGYSEAQGTQFYQRLLDRVKALPGVSAASLASHLPLGTASIGQEIRIEGGEPPAGQNGPGISTIYAAPGFFRAMDILLIRGRDFTARDKDAVVINEAMARRFWPDQDPIGRHFKVGDQRVEVIAVAKTGKYRTLSEDPQPFMYLPLGYRAHARLVVRTEGDPRSLVGAVRRQVQALDPNVVPIDLETMKEYMALPLFPAHTTGLLLGAFGLLALVLAVAGLYGVMAYAVSQRTHEIGVRMALGAGQRDVLILVVGQGMVLTLAGIGIGLAGAFAATRVLSSLLYGISATDPSTFVLVPFALAGVALAASYIPARRATKVDPMVALRYE